MSPDTIRAELAEKMTPANRKAFWEGIHAMIRSRPRHDVPGQEPADPREIAEATQERSRRHLRLVTDRGLAERDIPPRRRATVVRNCD